jgi:hypothetical protein
MRNIGKIKRLMSSTCCMCFCVAKQWHDNLVSAPANVNRIEEQLDAVFSVESNRIEEQLDAVFSVESNRIE